MLNSIERRRSPTDLLSVEDFCILAEAVEDGTLRRDVEEAKRGAKHGLRQLAMDDPRGLDGSPDEGEVHGRQEDRPGELDSRVDAEIPEGALALILGVDPTTDPPALSTL